MPHLHISYLPISNCLDSDLQLYVPFPHRSYTYASTHSLPPQFATNFPSVKNALQFETQTFWRTREKSTTFRPSFLVVMQFRSKEGFRSSYYLTSMDRVSVRFWDLKFIRLARIETTPCTVHARTCVYVCVCVCVCVCALAVIKQATFLHELSLLACLLLSFQPASQPVGSSILSN